MLAVELRIIHRRHDQDAAGTSGVGQRPDQNVAAKAGGHKNLQGDAAELRACCGGQFCHAGTTRDTSSILGRRALRSSVGKQIVGRRETYRRGLHARTV